MLKPKFQLHLLTRLLFFFIGFLLFLPFGISEARPTDTIIGGPISTDTILSAANSPYRVTSNINVYQNVTLLIEPGVTLKFDPGKKLLVNGALVARGTEIAPIIFTSSQADPQPGDWDKIEFSVTSLPTTVEENGDYHAGSVLEWCVVEYGGSVDEALFLRGILLDHCTVRQNNRLAIYAIPHVNDLSWITDCHITQNVGGAIQIETGVLMDSAITDNTSMFFPVYPTISAFYSQVNRNVIANNNSYSTALVLFGSTASASYNYIANNTNLSGGEFGGGVYLSGFGMVFEHNLVMENEAANGGGLYLLGSAYIRYNTFIRNINSGILVQYGSGEGSVIDRNVIIENSGNGVVTGDIGAMHYNTIYNNTPYDVLHTGTATSDGTLNYWGTTDTNVIMSSIYDFYDNAGYQEFLFNPFLNAPDPETPPIPPLNTTLQPLANGSMQVNWGEAQNTTESSIAGSQQTSSIAGYKVYYGASSTPPFNGTGQTLGDSPIDVGNVNSLVLSAPIPPYVSVTAYDAQGHESWFGPVISTDIVYAVYLPLIIR